MVIFDFIGALTKLTGYSLENSIEKLFKSFDRNGYKTDLRQGIRTKVEAMPFQIHNIF